MKNIFKYIGVFSLFIFSLFYTNKIVELMQSKTKIMQQIKLEKTKRIVKPVNAIIDKDYIIPGINGLEINEKDSYKNMATSGLYDEDLLIFNQVVPTISITNNIEKIIIKANKLKRAVSIIIDDQRLLNYCVKKGIRINYLIDSSNIIKSDKAELINNEITNYYKIENFLNLNNYNHNICVLNNNNDNICRNNKKYLVLPTYKVNDSNVIDYINEIDSGDIIKIEKMSVDNFDILINKIKYRDLAILYLSELISETNSNI